MANPYIQIFKAPGARNFSIAACIARLPNAMVFISLTLLLKHLGYAYSTASYITVTLVSAAALLSPLISQFADLHGQTKAICYFHTIGLVAMIALAIGSYYHLPLHILMSLALIAGFMPNFGALVRARWSFIYNGTKYIRSAFAFESIVDEVIFMIGPVVAIALTTNIAPYAGLIAALSASVIGAISFAAQTKTQPPVMNKKQRDKQHKGAIAISYPAVRILSLILFIFGIIYGLAELSTIAYCKEMNRTQFSAVPLVLYAVSSFLTGFIYGSVKKISIPLAKQLLYSIALSALASISFLYIGGLISLSFALFLSGASCAPTLIIASAIIEREVPSRKLTEAITWINGGLNLGTSFGYYLASQIIDNYGGVKHAFLFPLIASLAALLLAILIQNRLKHC